ncbi:hypothetical protein DTO271G3_8183 [Paecilomyces variotii]|nr:hypothetical protein DTO271G3_8183 [Paecilomyces variotii]
MADEGAPGGGSCAEERGEVGHQPSAVTAVGPTAQFSTFPSVEDDQTPNSGRFFSPSPTVEPSLGPSGEKSSLSILLFQQQHCPEPPRLLPRADLPPLRMTQAPPA